MPVKRNHSHVTAQIDDLQFRNMLLSTQVLTNRDFVTWDPDLILELLEGPLQNPKRLEEAFKVSKFGRRLMTFFHPLTKSEFSALSRSDTLVQERFCLIPQTAVSCRISPKLELTVRAGSPKMGPAWMLPLEVPPSMHRGDPIPSGRQTLDPSR